MLYKAVFKIMQKKGYYFFGVKVLFFVVEAQEYLLTKYNVVTYLDKEEAVTYLN